MPRFFALCKSDLQQAPTETDEPGNGWIRGGFALVSARPGMGKGPPGFPFPSFESPVNLRAMSPPDTHEPLSSNGSGDAAPWKQISLDPDFRALLADKVKFVAPATGFFLTYYFALPLLVGYAPAMMSKPVLGQLNAAYLFALSQFFMAWILAGFYVRAALRWDREAAAILKKFGLK
jgi:uncharacterized membrane protein (DUF485 family)